MSDYSVVFIEKLQKYLVIKEQPIVVTEQIRNIRPIGNTGSTSFFKADVILTRAINGSHISQEDKTAFLLKLDNLMKLNYLDISLVALKKSCNNSYLNLQLKDKAQESLDNIEQFNKLNKEFKKQFLSLQIPYIFEKVIQQYEMNSNGNYKLDERGYYILKTVVTPLAWEEVFFANKKITKNGQEGFDYAVNHIEDLLSSVLSQKEYQSQTDSSFIIYVNTGQSEGFFNKNHFTAPFNEALSFHDAKSAQRACSSRSIANYQIWQVSSKFIKQMNGNCNSGPVLQAIISQQEKSFIEESMKLQEVIDMKNKIEKYEKLLRENAISYEEEKSETKRVNKL